MRSFLTGTEWLEMLGKYSVIYSLMAMLFLLNVVAIPYPFSLVLNAPFVLITIYYWILYRPTLLPLWLIFTAGLAIDVLSGFPIGTNALLFTLTRMFVLGQRRFLVGQNAVMIWLSFCALNVVVHLLQWGLVSVFQLSILPLSPIVIPCVLGIAFFPIVSLLYHMVHKLLPQASVTANSALK